MRYSSRCDERMNHGARCQLSEQYTGGSFGYKVGQIATKWDKFGTFSDQISVHFCAPDLSQYDLVWAQI